ncbi:MAG: glycosyltransferase [Chitinophagaceae bacterium]|nr:glycosyltransferase [Chitinophagaceae bacterium]
MLSFIIPCFNHGHYLSDCLNSIYLQSNPNWEAIIVNDGSTDDSLTIINKWVAKDNRFYFINKPNGGLSSARNEGILNAKGKVFCFLDSDDCILPGMCDIILKSINDHKNINIFQSSYRYIYGVNKEVLRVVNPEIRKTLFPDILTFNFGPIHSFFFRREVFAHVNYFDCSLKSAEDWDFLIRVMKSGINDIYFIDKVLVDYRIDDNSMSRNAFRMYEALKTVSFSAVKFDSRLSTSLPFNIDYEINPINSIKRNLLLCLGVSIAQGRIDDSIQLLNDEKQKFNFNIDLLDYSRMCSYLSFRYRKSESDLLRIENVVIPNFILFFKKLGFNDIQVHSVIYLIFDSFFKIKRKQKWKFLSPFVNFFYS